MYKHSLKDRISKNAYRREKCIQLKYQEPHSPSLTRNSIEEQFTPPRREKLLDVESKTLISTDAQHLGNNLDTGKNIISFPHDVAAENRYKKQQPEESSRD